MPNPSKRTARTPSIHRLPISEPVFSWLVDCALSETRERTVSMLAPKSLPEDILELQRKAIFIERGAILHLSFADSLAPEQIKRAALAFTALIGTAVQVEKDVNDYWYSLGVDPAASPVAANGLGPNVPHIDMLTYSDFPNAMAILCERPDPSGGGLTVLSDINGAIEQVPADHQRTLCQAVFSYWEDHGLFNVGDYLPTWSVLPTPLDPRFRFTAKLLNRMAKEPLSVKSPAPYFAAVSEIITAIKAHSISIHLQAGECILFSQNHYCHGRTSLGDSTLDVPPNARRQLWRLYFNHQ